MHKILRKILYTGALIALLGYAPSSLAQDQNIDVVHKAASFKFFNSMAHHNPSQDIRWQDTDLSMYGFENENTHAAHVSLWDYGTWNQSGCAGSSTHAPCDYAQTVDEAQVLEFAETLEDDEWVFLDIEFLPENLVTASYQYDNNDELIRDENGRPFLDLDQGRAALQNTVDMYVQIVDLIRSVKPNVKIGNYGTGSANYLYIYESCIDWLPNHEETCRLKDDLHAEGMEIFLDYFKRVDAILPSAYMHMPITDYQNGRSTVALEWRQRWKARVIGQARHARMISQKLVDRGLKNHHIPVYFYMSPVFTTGPLWGQFLAADHMQEQIDHVYDLADGIIYWGVLRNAPVPDATEQPSMHTVVTSAINKIKIGSDWNGDNMNDLFDISRFINLYHDGSQAIDIAYPPGIINDNDVMRFVEVFSYGSDFRANPPVFPGVDNGPTDPQDEPSNNGSDSSDRGSANENGTNTRDGKLYSSRDGQDR